MGNISLAQSTTQLLLQQRFRPIMGELLSTTDSSEQLYCLQKIKIPCTYLVSSFIQPCSAINTNNPSQLNF